MQFSKKKLLSLIQENLNEMPMDFDSQDRPDQGVQDDLAAGETPLQKIPFPETGEEPNKNFQELLASERYKQVVAKMRQYTGTNATIRGTQGMTPLMQQMMSAHNQILQFEQNHRRELEQLAVELVMKELGIPEDATVFGGYGGKDSFSILYVKQVVYVIAQQFPHMYFLFANFPPFCPSLPNIIHHPAIISLEDKVKFIQTCDAMLWARHDGETFGLAIAEFSIKNKPIFCTSSGDLAHLQLLKQKAIVYNDPQDLANKLVGFNKDNAKGLDWSAYRDYEPEKTMQIFKSYLD